MRGVSEGSLLCYKEKTEEIVKKQELIEYVENIALPLTKEMGYELYDVDYVKEGPSWYLKVFADKDGGFSINDCVALSRALEAKLEENDPIDTAYVLEVSSPGLDRPLKKEKDFVRSIGKIVDVKLYQALPQTADQKSFQAKLIGYQPDKQQISLELEDGTEITIAQNDMAGIRLAVIF